MRIVRQMSGNMQKNKIRNKCFIIKSEIVLIRITRQNHSRWFRHVQEKPLSVPILCSTRIIINGTTTTNSSGPKQRWIVDVFKIE